MACCLEGLVVFVFTGCCNRGNGFEWDVVSARLVISSGAASQDCAY